MDPAEERARMVERQIAARGVKDRLVLAAMTTVPRELFVPEELREFAWQDSALPIDAGQTISQPYIVAVMAQALRIGPGSKVLEIGAGSGYAAAVLAEIAGEAWTIERHAALVETARANLAAAGYADRVHVLHGDGTLGWPEHAPFDAIAVAAGSPEPPPSLREQLAPGGRLVVPVGETPELQRLLVIVRRPDGGFREEDLGPVRFVPLVGEEGWTEDLERAGAMRRRSFPDRLGDECEAFDSPESADLSWFLDRVGDARIVLLGEATHGTAEFYRMRDRMTRELIRRRGFDVVAAEADWPDASRIDHYIRDVPRPPAEWAVFARFPEWMWRNEEFRAFVHWLRAENESRPAERRVAFHGLDLYSLYRSIEEVLEYLDERDPEAARTARTRYGCLTPWQSDPATYGRAVLRGRFRDCEEEVVANLRSLLTRRLAEPSPDGERFHDAVQNARLVVSAERYYRSMYYGSRESWNLRDTHMIDTLAAILEHRGPDSRAVVWAHNSHVGDASATDFAARGEINLGQLCRERFGADAVYLVGFGTHAGTVAAATEWGAPVRTMEVRPSRDGSYERLFHEVGIPSFLLPLREMHRGCRTRLSGPRLERAIGVVYRPETELASHYFEATLPRQFDEYAWFDETTAVTPLAAWRTPGEVPPTYPFGV